MQFNDGARNLSQRRDHAPLVDYATLGEAARCRSRRPSTTCLRSTFWGAQRDDDALSVMTDGIELGSIGMLSFAIAADGRGATQPPSGSGEAPRRTANAPLG